MARLRMEPHVVATLRPGDVYVEILELLGHLGDEGIAPALGVDGIERARKTAAGPAVERRHPGGISRVATTATTESPTTAPGAASTSRARGTVGTGEPNARAIAWRAAATASATTTLGLRDTRDIDAELLGFHLHIE